MAKLLVTGGAGFIGSHLAANLVDAGHDVTAIDDLSTGSIENVSALEKSRRFELIIANVREMRAIDSLVRDSDAVFHLAASVGVEQTVARPASVIENNLIGTQAVLSAAARHRRHVLIASSSEVYGAAASAAPHEEGAPLRLGVPALSRWAYAGSKACEEYLALSLHQERSLPVVVIRLFNIVGPRQSDQYGMVLPRFAQQALSGNPITVHGSGEQRRCFLDVRDAVRGLSDLLMSTAAIGEIVNLGSGEELSVLELAIMVRAAARSASEIVHLDSASLPGRGPADDAQRRVPSLAKIQRLIAWRPQYSCADSVDAVIEHLRRTSALQENTVASVA